MPLLGENFLDIRLHTSAVLVMSLFFSLLLGLSFGIFNFYGFVTVFTYLVACGFTGIWMHYLLNNELLVVRIPTLIYLTIVAVLFMHLATWGIYADFEVTGLDVLKKMKEDLVTFIGISFILSFFMSMIVWAIEVMCFDRNFHFEGE